MASVVATPPPLASHLIQSYSPSQQPLSSSEPLAIYLQLSSPSLNIDNEFLDPHHPNPVKSSQSANLAPSRPPSPGAGDAAPFRRVLSRQHSATDGLSLNPYSSTQDYYNVTSTVASQDPKNRTYSERTDRYTNADLQELRRRRLSQDVGGPRKLVVEVDSTYAELLAREDTDNNGQITVKDHGPKVLTVGTAASDGYRRVDLRGTYVLSSLLQELTLAKDRKLEFVVLQEERLNESPDKRLERFIKEFFWPNLTRRIDARNILQVADDPKDWNEHKRPRIYVPHGAPEQYEYYSRVAKKHPEHNLDVQWLASTVTPEYVRDLNAAPGLLALDMEPFTNDHGERDLRGKPFIVPGGRFNELYGWDSYMASLGLLLSDNVDICKSMVENFCFCIKHYGKILNANRTYYLGRSQPPFLTDMTLRVYDRIRHKPGALEFLQNAALAAIKEYYTIWMAAPRLDPKTGLSRYRPEGLGVPPETESTHFDNVLKPYAEKYSMSKKEFIRQYNAGHIREPDLDEYFLHDRAVRESGHDTTYRLERVAADVATVDLNSCLYKIECDIARIIRGSFQDSLPVPTEFRAPGRELDHVETSANWDRRARYRRLAMDKYMWNEEKGMYFDYNTVKEEISTYESATTFWALWAGVATPRQASCMVVKAVDRFEEKGGLAAGTEESRGAVGLHRPNRQWDYPFGWAPQQILAWSGLQRYHHDETAQRLAYKWAYMMTKAFHDFNGVVVEKYDVTRPDDPHEVEAEYGNQGADFRGVPREGFGWVNASYLIALDILDADQRRNIGLLVDWDSYWNNNKSLSIENTYMEQTDPGIGRVRTGLFHEYSSQPDRVNVPIHVVEHLRQSHAGALHRHEKPGSLGYEQRARPLNVGSSERRVEINYHDNECAIADSPTNTVGAQLGRTSSQVSQASSKASQANSGPSTYQGD